MNCVGGGCVEKEVGFVIRILIGQCGESGGEKLLFCER